MLAAALAVLKPLPLMPSGALAHVTPDPRDQLLKETPAGGVVQVAVGTAGQVTAPPPPTVTVVCPQELALARPRTRLRLTQAFWIMHFVFIVGLVSG